MSWIARVLTWLSSQITLGPAPGSERREDFNTFTAEMWKYVERLGADYEKRLSDLQADYEKRLSSLQDDYERRLSEIELKHRGVTHEFNGTD